MSNQQKFQEILSSSAKKICVIAGPGSGKTKGILIPKAKQIISDKSIDPQEVLVLSFSRPSAQDLRKRVKQFDRVPRASTLHSFCLSFLLSEDNHDIRKRVKSIVLKFEKDIMLSDLKVLFSDLDKRKLGKMLDEFSAGWAVSPHDKVFDEDENKRSFKAGVLRWLDEHEAALMEEIVYHAVDLAKKVKAEFIEKPQYIFVDEFQDLNKLEQEFVELLSRKSKLILVVGDPDQSIYSFKYAHPEGINTFADENDVEKHSLYYSERCAKKILDIANQLLRQASPARIEFLQSPPDAPDGEAVLIPKNTQEEELSFVFTKILQKVEGGTDPREIIVLVPRKKLGIEFVRYTKTQNLPKDISFRFVVKDEYSPLEQEKILLLGIIANPSSILRIRSYIGLGDRGHFSNEFVELKKKYGNLKEALQKADPKDFNRGRRKTRLLCSKIQELKTSVEQYTGEENIDKILDAIIPPSVEELEDIRKIFLGSREEGDSLQSLYAKFLDYSRTVEAGSKTVRVMTLLASKGLDADCVFILGCNDGNIPGENRSTYLSDYNYKQEQRRLLYVGVTRAKKCLIISWSRNIPFRQSRGHYTRSVRTITLHGEQYSQVGLSEFLQDVKFK